MTSITLPFWIFALSLGVPGLIFLCLVGLLLRKIKNPKKNEFANVTMQHIAGTQFHNDLLCSQIDTIFNGLNAILETERVKIRALLSSGNVTLSDAQVAPVDAFKAVCSEVAQSQTEETHTVDQHFTMRTETVAQEDVTLASGLSQSEIDLAMRMRSSRDAIPIRKLEAVA